MAGSDEGAQSGTRGAPMTPGQSRAARGLLGWSEADLAARVGLAEDFVRSVEGGYGDPPAGQVEALRSALVAAGIAFTDSPTQGVRLAERPGADEGTRLDALTTENDR
ncbi:XRE family transcriptional regulator [Methylobacterium sp. NEAU 140]|uniref:helix-turn-helix domain-containing protein n=1 Tax=Methylobacterium sp. NEAU 140 TaxID=3064945 RepID=UPI0027370365|nr:XRE family transcriptional regulator [Methylobacterium sp. NEAU 140]MDP4021449.1 XRE family transcriptional regulator [Methylobacterium sp. NEAU 140]